MKVKIILIIGLFVPLLSAQETLTFEEAIAIALEHNHQIQIARNTADIAANNATIGNADLLPKIGVTGSTIRTDREEEASTSTTASVSASYTLFDGFGNVYRFKSLQAGKDIGMLDARDQIESTLLQISNAYFLAALSYENLQIAQELVSISQERLARAQKRSAFGRARTIDVLAAQVDLNADSVTVAQARFTWDETRRNMNVLLNRDVEIPFRVETEIAFNPLHDLETLKAKAFEQNAEYLSIGKRLQQARFDLNTARSAHLPTLDLSASYGLNQTYSDLAVRLSDPAKTVTLGATVSFNLFDGLKTHIRRQNAQLTVKTQESLVEQARLNLEKNVTSAYETYKNSRLVLNLEERSLEAAELNFKRTEELYHLGQVTTTQFREAQLNLIRAKSNLLAAKYDAKLSEIELLKLSGGLLKIEE